jgi:hypothetical protein
MLDRIEKTRIIARGHHAGMSILLPVTAFSLVVIGHKFPSAHEGMRQSPGRLSA